MKKTLLIIFILTIFSHTKFTDNRDQNQYTKISTGNTIWLKENLKYIFKDNKTVSYKFESYYDTFGAYYTLKSSKKACPKGFHLASLKDYKRLFSFMEGKENKLQGKQVTKDELAKYGFQLGGLTTGKKVKYANNIGFYWTSTDTLKIDSKEPNKAKKKHYVAIHIYKNKSSDLYNIEPTYMPARSDNSIAINCKCVIDTIH